jgi:hypothetical protein
MAKGSDILADQSLELDALVKLLGPSPDCAIINARFRRYVLAGALVDEQGTSPEIWRQCFDEIGPDEFPRWWPIRYYLDQAQEWSRRFYMPRFRRGVFLALFHDLKAQSESDIVPLSPTAEPASWGRPGYLAPILAEAQRRIDEGEVVPTPKGLSRFARDLWQWWEEIRGNRPARQPRYIANGVRPIWNARLHKTK